MVWSARNGVVVTRALGRLIGEAGDVVDRVTTKISHAELSRSL